MYHSLNNNGSMPQESSLLTNYYNDDIHSKSPQELFHTPSSSSFLLPSPIYTPLEDEAAFCESFQQQQFFSNDHNHNILVHEMSNNVETAMGEFSNNGEIATNNVYVDHCDFISHVEPDNYSPRKIPSNRNRQSKINTARGPRDQRMRLSLDVAKRLFGLQDLLGFDKASKAVDWLLKEAKAAILDLLPDQSSRLMGVSNSTSSTSECEVVSGIGDQFTVKTADDQATTKNKAKSSSGRSKKQKEKLTRVRKCADFQHPLAKETRIRARERARERTIEKQNNYKRDVGQDSTFRPFLDHLLDQDVNKLGYWSTFEESQPQHVDRDNQMSSNFQFSQGFVGGDDSSSLLTGNCTPTYFFDYQNSSRATDEQQFSDFQRKENVWERNNN